MPRKHDRRFEDFAVGDCVAFTRRFEEADFKAFAALSGDRNPLHHDAAYAQASHFDAPIMPLHLTAMPLSAIAGMMLPGHRALYLSSRVSALAPAPYGTEIGYSAKVIGKSEAKSTLTLRVIAYRGCDVLLTAEMLVRVREDVPAELAPAAPDVEILRETKGTVAVTGATGEIGAAAALALARDGWNLILLHRGKTEAAKSLKQACAAAGAEVSLLSAALDDRQQLKRACARLAKTDAVTAILHAASPPIEAAPDELLTVNHSALARLSQALLPNMLKQQSGTVLFLGSSALQHNPKGWEGYVAAKAAASHYVTGLNERYGSYGIAGWVVAPGYVDSAYSRAYRPPEASALLPEQVAESVVACLRDAPEGKANYLWIEPGGRRLGGFGFHQGGGAAPVQQAQAETVTQERAMSATPGRANGRDAESVIRAFLGAPANSDLSEAGVDSYPGWDSLRHLELLLHLEQELGLSFTSGEMEETTRFRDLCALLAEKQARASTI